MKYKFDRNVGRYRDERGRFVSERAVRDGIDAVIDDQSKRIERAAQKVRNGRMSPTEFRAELFDVIKKTQLVGAIAAQGGKDAFKQSGGQYDVQKSIQRQLEFGQGFVQDIVSGVQPLNGTLVQRAKLYPEAGRVTFEEFRRLERQIRGDLYERNVLHAAESCQMCLDQTAAGSVPIGTLIPVGQRTCRSRCKCTLTFSRVPIAEVA